MKKTKRSRKKTKLKVRRIPEAVEWWLARIGQPLRIVRRDTKEFVGFLADVEFEPKEVILLAEEEWKEYTKKTKVREVKLVRIPMNALMDLEFILERQETKEEEKTS